MERTLEEIEDILWEADTDPDDPLVKLVIKCGLGVEHCINAKEFVIIYPKLKFGMPQHELYGRIVKDEGDWCYNGIENGDTELKFEVDGCSFSLKAKEIEDCRIIKDLNY